MTISPIKAKLVPHWVAQLDYARSACVDVAHKVIIRRHRSSKQVNADYDAGEWKDHLRQRAWESSRSLQEYVLGVDQRRVRAQVDGRLCDICLSDYYRYRTDQIVSLLREFDGGSPRMVEVGCGAGRNLFACATSGRWKELRGLELSHTGIEVIRAAASHFGLDYLSAGPIDLLDDRSPGFAELRGATAFTHYCLEQLPHHTESVLRRLAAAGVRRVIHIEPTMEFFQAWSLRDLASMAYIWRQDYLADLVKVARRLEREGVLRVVAVRRLGFAPTLRNTPTLVVWEPLASSSHPDT